MAIAIAVVTLCGDAAAEPSDGGRTAMPSAALADEGSPDRACSIPALWDAFVKGADTKGIGVSVVYDGEGLANVLGGIRTGSVYLGVLHLQLTIDGERLVGWHGSTFFVEGIGIHGGHPSEDLVGDAQGVSNFEAPAGWELYETWLQQNWLGNRFSALAGLYDLNTEFYRLQSATLFVNSSFGVGPDFAFSGREGPSIFPDTSLGLRAAFKPRRGIVLRMAILDGVPFHRPDGRWSAFAKGDGLLLVGEAAFLSRPAPEDHPAGRRRFLIGRGSGLPPYDSKLAVGGWYYTAPFDDLSEREPDGRPVRHRGSAGAYVLGDALVYRSATMPRRQLSAFAELGFGDPRVNRFGFYAAGGLVYAGLLPALVNDELGLAVASARNGSHFVDFLETSDVPVTGTETTIELTYLMQINQHVALQPDFQYVIHPGTDPARRNALAVALRFEISL